MKRYVALNSEPTPVEALRVERRRLEEGVGDDERFLGSGAFNFYVVCDGNAADVLFRAKQVMRILNGWALAGDWPTDEQWPNLLPRWFVDACAPNKTPEEHVREVQEFCAMTDEESIQFWKTRIWPLDEFTHWMKPSLRLNPNLENMWVWFDAEVLDEDRICVYIDDLSDSPETPEEIRWLFMACGGKDMDDIRDIEHMIGVRPA